MFHRFENRKSVVPAMTETDDWKAARYAYYFKQMPFYLFIVDHDLQIVDTNEQFEKTFGPSFSRHCFEVCRRREEPCHDCPVEQTFSDGSCRTVEALFVNRKGEDIPLVVSTAPIRDVDGKVVSVMKMGMAAPDKQLQSKLESLGLLIGTISHSIKGLCTGLDGGIYLCNSGSRQRDAERKERGWAMVQRNANRLRRLVNNTLYYAKERRPQLADVLSEEIHHDVIATLEAKAKRLGIQTESSVNDAWGSFRADSAAVTAALVNLFENSLDACHADTEKEPHFVALTTQGLKDVIQFKIRDNGVGMDLEICEKATELFFSSKGAGGTGMGLYIAHQIATAHGGDLIIESTLGEGTNITVELPRGGPKTALPKEQMERGDL